jgi:hypothetical protein
MKTTDYSKLVHFFGEMDLDLTKNSDQIYKEAFRIAECCGYVVTRYFSKEFKGEEKISLYGHDAVAFQLWFFKKKFKMIAFRESGEKRQIRVVTQIPNFKGSGYMGYFP